jgi:hypothetical protein
MVGVAWAARASANQHDSVTIAEPGIPGLRRVRACLILQSRMRASGIP